MIIHWFKPDQPAQAVVVVVHGLNLLPSKMDELCAALKISGCEVLRLSLTGHDRSLNNFKKATREVWLSEIVAAYGEAKKIADTTKVPLHFLGFSLGALLNADALAQNPAMKYDRMVMIAPALVLRPHSYAIRLFSIFGPSFNLVSWNRADYRVQSFTPVGAYEALFDSMSALRSVKSENLNCPALIFMHPDDELVSFTGLQKFIEKRRLSEWRMFVLQGAKPIFSRVTHHLMIDSETMGRKQFKAVSEAMVQFLLNR